MNFGVNPARLCEYFHYYISKKPRQFRRTISPNYSAITVSRLHLPTQFPIRTPFPPPSHRLYILENMSGFRGVSADQDSRFKTKEKNLLKTIHKFEPDQKSVNFSGVNWEVIKPWLSKRVTELLGGVDDDVVVLYIEEQVVGKKSFDPRQLVVNIAGFLEGQSDTFVRELWSLLVSASKSTSGIPQSLLVKKHAELQMKQEVDFKVLQQIERSRKKAYGHSSISTDHPGRYTKYENRRGSRDVSPEQRHRGESIDKRRYEGSPFSRKRTARSRSPDRKGDMR